MSAKILLMFFGSIAFQIFCVSQLPRSEGFTRPVPTMLCVGSLVAGFWILARMVHDGVGISVLTPLVAAVIPLASIAIGVMIYGEPASFIKIILLATACGLVGVAAQVG